MPGTVATVGRLEVEPGAENVIPARATASVDARAVDRDRLDRLVAAIGLEPHLRTEPVAMDEGIRAALREHVEGPELVSGAGHDAGVLAAAGVSCGMLFVRSVAGGVSHSPDEWTEPDDVAAAVDALTVTLSSLAK